MKGITSTLVVSLWFVQAVSAQTTSENFVLSRTYKNAGMSETSGTTYTGTPATVQTSIVYLDGLGKTRLEVAASTSPTQKDILSQTIYDALMRPSHQYMPVASSTGDGSFRASVDMSYYNSANVCAGTTAAYVQTLYEPSPLSRVSQQVAPGVAVGSGVRTNYKTNESSELVGALTILVDLL